MDFSKIFNGMVGRDFIKAFNDNFTITDEAFLSILATLIYKVKSTDIKEFKVINNVVSYTLEEEPTEGEDTREWTPVDITKWGNIEGDITDQDDLMAILNDKAAVDTVVTLSNLVSTLSTNYSALRTKVLENETVLNTDTNDIADMQIVLETAVQSTNIKALRLNNSVFQWSPDGRTWYEQPTTNTVAWGRITGDITTQQDLMLIIGNINSEISSIDSDITTINNTLSSMQQDITSLNTSLTNHIADFTAYQNQVSNAISAIRTLAEDTEDMAEGVSDDLAAHIADYNNPHGVTKADVLLGNVDNTSDINKPLSTAQKNYVDAQIADVRETIIDRSNLVSSSGFVDKLFVGPASEYNDVGSIEGMLAFVLDDSFFSATISMVSTNYSVFDLYDNNVLVTPDVQTADTKVYSVEFDASSIFTVKVEVDGVLTTYNVDISYKLANNIDIDELVEGGNA